MPSPPTNPGGVFPMRQEDLAFATDLYQLTMAAADFAEARASGEMPRAVFELWVRRLPPRRRFLVFAGLEQALAALETLRFDAAQIEYLRGLRPFAGVDEAFFAALADFRFRGDLRAMPEGTLFFPGEPVLAVHGSLLEAQVVETLLLSIVNFQSAIASKAARLRLAAGATVRLAELGSRRAHGPQAAAWAARAAWVGGVDSTSNLLAGQRTGMPVVGTMAHSFVMAFEREIDAFRSYQRTFPDDTTLLVDTYDTLEGVRRALASGDRFTGVRLDSGEVGGLARATRQLLDDNGRRDARILVSGDMDELMIAALLAEGAPIDAFGVGTQLATSADAPYLPGIYKLVEIERGGRRRATYKASPGKVTYPGPKQVVRSLRETADGPVMGGDRLLPWTAEGDDPDGERLLVPVMAGGERIAGGAGDETARDARERCRRGLARLPAELRGLDEESAPYPVTIDPALERLLAAARAQQEG